MTTGQTITIDYGAGDGGAVVPKTAGTSGFDIEIKGSETGQLKSVKVEAVTVLSQASGRGTVAIDTDGDVHAGQTGRAFAITYTAEGQIVGGRLKVTVPDGDDWADAMAANFSGSATYGGDLSETALEENEEIGSVNELIVSGINLRADQTLTLTYMTDIQATASEVDGTFASLRSTAVRVPVKASTTGRFQMRPSQSWMPKPVPVTLI